MSKTYFNVLKKDAEINVTFTTDQVAELHSILLRHLDNMCHLDTKSWESIESLCLRIDTCAASQSQFEQQEVNF